MRSALFVVPAVVAGKLPPLPTSDDPSLIQSCRLEEIWFETATPVSRDALIAVLASTWGQPNGPSQSFRDGVPFVGSRKNLAVWNRAGMDVWVVDRIGPKLPVAVYARNQIALPADWYDTIGPLQMKVAAQSGAPLAKIAALDPGLTKAVLARPVCTAGSLAPEDPQLTASRLEKWLSASRGLAAIRRAAALLIADYYMTCSANAPQNELRQRYEKLGAEFSGACPQYSAYGHNVRKQSAQIDAEGYAGGWAALASFWDQCSIANGQITKNAETLAGEFPEWRPALHYALARSLGAALSRDYPGGDPEEGLVSGPPQENPARIGHDRKAAIQAFTTFLRESPNDSEAPFAWQEVWRLRAGLKPTRVPFGCSCE